MSPEKRASRRVMSPLDLECWTLSGPQTPVTARVSDLSGSGAFLDCMNPVPVGTRLALRFVLGEYLVEVTAEVMHVMPQFGMGVRFLDLPAGSRAAIEQLLADQR
jgi:hypothetical protein